MSIKAKLEYHGWTMECENPLEVRHEDGSFATGQAAQTVTDSLSAPPAPEELKYLVKKSCLDILINGLKGKMDGHAVLYDWHQATGEDGCVVAEGLHVNKPEGWKWYMSHHQDCGTKYRGCSPECPKDQVEKYAYDVGKDALQDFVEEYLPDDLTDEQKKELKQSAEDFIQDWAGIFSER